MIKINVKKSRENDSRIVLFDVLKGLMMLFVIITHYNFVYPNDYLKYGFPFYIDMAVPVFMLVTGYLSASSFERKNITSIEQGIGFTELVPKILRFLIPFSMAFAFELPFLINRGDSVVGIIKYYVSGGFGPGSYYTPVMLQVVLLSPVIYYIIKKYDFFGTIWCFVATGLWEAIQFSWDVNDAAYRIIALRYISIIAFGMYVAVKKEELNYATLSLIFVVGIVWQVLLMYLPLNPLFINVGWARVNYISSLFASVIFYYIIKKFKNCQIKSFILKNIGKASYNIFLVQMIFYAFFAGGIYGNIEGTMNQLICCIMICCVIGYIFYLIENKVSKMIMGFLKSKNYYFDIYEKSVKKINSVTKESIF